jgi:enoyl-CoA hydratase/carnithine racemase
MTMLAVKRTVDELLTLSPGADLAECDRLVAACFASEDYIEGRTAFMEKRKPVFKGR